MKALPSKKTSKADLDALLKDKMEDILALIEAMASEQPDCDLKLAELLENESEQGRQVIVEKLREMLRERAAEKEQELNKHLDAQKRVEVTRQKNMFSQWLAWIMSEETLRKIRMAFMASPRMEAQVKNIGMDLANFGLQTQLADKRELGGISANVGQGQAGQRDKGGDKGRQ